MSRLGWLKDKQGWVSIGFPVHIRHRFKRIFLDHIFSYFTILSKLCLLFPLLFHPASVYASSPSEGRGGGSVG